LQLCFVFTFYAFAKNDRRGGVGVESSL